MAKPMVKKGVQRILLCGFMGCGKTSVGQALSFRLKWEFLDTDAMIEKREGRKIPEIFCPGWGSGIPSDGGADRSQLGAAQKYCNFHWRRLFDAAGDSQGVAGKRRWL